MEIIAGAILTEPFISQVVGVLMGQDQIPGFRTIFGLTIITVGCLMASYGTRVKAVEHVEKLLDDEELTSKLGLSMINRSKRLSSGP